MHSSTSSSEPSGFGRALACLAVIATVAVGGAHAVGRLYHPQALAPQADQVARYDHFVAIFGNSRTEAGIVPLRLAQLLEDEGRVGVAAFGGGGWDSLHFYMLSLMATAALRPDRDAVIIETSPLSMNDDLPSNRLGAIRPDAALDLARLPGTPVETRLDLVLGAFSGLYRYRTSLQAAVGTRLEQLTGRLAGPLGRLRVVGPPAAEPAFRLLTAPGRDFVIDRVEGDVGALKVASKRSFEVTLKALAFGGFKWRALERAVRMLRARRLQVYLVELPLADWAQAEIEATTAHQRFRDDLSALARTTGAHVIATWPRVAYQDTRFFDGMHMVASASEAFMRLLTDRIRATAWLAQEP
jgi:hypothetical protein